MTDPTTPRVMTDEDLELLANQPNAYALDNAAVLATISHHRTRAEQAEAKVAGLVEALRASQAWQPIETAPRDGTPVLACIENSVSYVAWTQNGDAKFWGRQWAFLVDHEGSVHTFNPTHWLPLPKPPLRTQPQASTGDAP